MENKFSTIKERVVFFAEYKQVIKEDFFKKIGITSANFRGKAKNTPLNSNTIANIFTMFPDISLEWLLTGSGEMLRNEPKISDITSSTDFGNKVSDRDMSIYHTISSESVAENNRNYNDIIRKQHEQIDNLISIINKLSDK